MQKERERPTRTKTNFNLMRRVRVTAMVRVSDLVLPGLNQQTRQTGTTTQTQQ